MENKYQSEIDEFHKNFDQAKGKRIVLYGIGRYTATLVDGVRDHCFVGLMDKDEKNIGREIFGLPVLSLSDAEEKADLIIINTSGTYWNVIYRRIKDSKIPVYFLNGKLAEEDGNELIESDYWQCSLDELEKKIGEAEAVSFDFYDTLFLRKLCNPTDVFGYLDKEWELDSQLFKWGMDSLFSYAELRNRAIRAIDENYTLDELYAEMERILCQTYQQEDFAVREQTVSLIRQQLESFKTKELALERKLLVPRRSILQCMRKAIDLGKDVYLLSDMYLPKSFFAEVLRENHIEIETDRLLISCEERKSKKNGDLWERYAAQVVKGRSALHIGDNERSDIEAAQRYGISAYKVASMLELLRMSSIREIEPEITSLESSELMGILSARKFNDPFMLGASHGIVNIDTAEEMGFFVFGPVIAGFLDWLRKETKKDSVNRLLFLSRDGYFLKEDYEYYCGLSQMECNCSYIGISRQLAMTASIQTEEDLWDFIRMPYSGTPTELLEDRFGIGMKQEDLDKDMGELYKKYKEQIWNYAERIRREYLEYLTGQELDNDCAVVDLGFYGNNQRYLNELAGLRMSGYYFNADLSEENPNARKNVMRACFQRADDKKGTNSKVLEKMIFIESFLSAPYGMVKEVRENGEFVCAEGKGNQRHFSVKEQINKGVKQFIKEYVEHKIEIDKVIEMIEIWYGLCIGGKVEYSEEIKKSFYNDNAMMNRFEANLFE